MIFGDSQLEDQSVIMSYPQPITGNLPDSTTILDLSLHPEKICRIEPLNRFPHLKVLNLSNHLIQRIENIPSSVVVLNLEFNQIQRLENIRHLVLLEELYLSSNNIRGVEGLQPNRSLRILELGYNDLPLNSLSSIAECEGLSILTLEGNREVEKINYKMITAMMMKSLIMLDKQSVKKGKEMLEGDNLFLKDIFRESEDEKQTITKEVEKIKENRGREREKEGVEESPEQIILGRINRIKLENIRLIDQIVQFQEKVEEMEEDSCQVNRQQEEDELLRLIEKKYQDSLRLQRELKVLEQISHPTLPEQKQRNHLLETLIENEEILEEYQRQLQEIRGAEEYQTIKSLGPEHHSQINEMKGNVLELRKKLRHNENLIVQYSNNLDSNFKTQQQTYIISLLSKLVFGEEKELDKQKLQSLCSKYQSGLLRTLKDLILILFGKQPPASKITELKESLNGTALLDWFSEKRGKSKKDKRFLKEKQNFIMEFEKETEELVESWLELKKEEDRFYKKLGEFEKRQKNQQEEFKEKLKETKEEYNRGFKRELEEQIGTLNHLKIQISSLQQQKQLAENQIIEFKQSIHHLEVTKSELEKVKHQIRKKKLELESLAETSQSSMFQSQSIQKKFYQIQQKYNQKYSQYLSIEAESKVLNSKLALVQVQYTQTQKQLEENKEQLGRVRRMINEEEKVLEKAKTGVMMMEDKLDNLNKLSVSKKYMLDGIEREIGRMAGFTFHKKKSSQSQQQLLIQGSIRNKRSFQL